jgi:hypothetical protein
MTGTDHRVVVIEHGGPHVLQLIEEDLPEPGHGEVRVQVLAAGVSAFDLIYRRWPHLPGSPKVPFTLGEWLTANGSCGWKRTLMFATSRSSTKEFVGTP